MGEQMQQRQQAKEPERYGLDQGIITCKRGQDIG
jgi:hypothetical protein